jgi:hypothetical protein
MKDKKHHPVLRILNNRKGVSAILVAIFLPVLIGFAALAIDVGYMYTTKNELQNIADASALAGAGEMGKIYLSLDPSTHESFDFTGDPETQIQAAVTAVADLNKHDNENEFVINTDDISIGVWNWNLKRLDPADPANDLSADAVQVIARRDASANNPVTTFFARIFSIFGGDNDTFESAAVATAALSGPASVAEGVAKAPFGLSYAVFDDDCPDQITFNSAQDNLVCTAWHNFHDPINPPANTDALDQGEKMLSFINSDITNDGPDWLGEHFTDWNKLDDVEDETSPEINIGDEFYFTWGVQSLIKEETSANTLYNTITTSDSRYTEYYTDGNSVGADDIDDFYSDTKKKKEPNPMSTAFNYWRFNDDDNDDTKWTTTIPVYDQICGDPANSKIQIVGFADVAVTAVHGPPLSSIDVEIDCSMKVIEGRGGGGNANYGRIKGSIPSLVQ